MAEISRRNLFAAGAAGAAGLAAMSGAATTAAAQTGRKPVVSDMVTRVGLPNVWGQEFLSQWSPNENYKRNLKVGNNVIRMAGRPQITNAPGTDYGKLFQSMADKGWSATEAASANWLSRQMPDSEKQEIKAQLKAHDIRFYNIHCAGNIIAPDPDAERWQRHIIEAIHSAEEFGCETILTHTGSMYPNRNTSHPQNWSKEAWERSVKALKRIAKDTAGSKVDIAIEPVNTESINNPWAMRRLRDDVDSDRIACGLDITNMIDPSVVFRMTEFTDTTFDVLDGMVRYVHAKDVAWNSMLAGLNWTMNGTGTMDYELWLSRLSRLTRSKEIFMLVEFLTTDEEYSQAQRNIRAIADKIGVNLYGKQPANA